MNYLLYAFVALLIIVIIAIPFVLEDSFGKNTKVIEEVEIFE